MCCVVLFDPVVGLPSWPKTQGRLAGRMPFMQLRSVWQMPVAAISTRASSGRRGPYETVSSFESALNSLWTSAVVIDDIVQGNVDCENETSCDLEHQLKQNAKQI